MYQLGDRVQTSKWNAYGGIISVEDRLAFSRAIAQNKIGFFVNGSELTLNELFSTIKRFPLPDTKFWGSSLIGDDIVEKWPIQPFSRGSEGFVFRFLVQEEEAEEWTPSIVVKLNVLSDSHEAFFTRWMSEDAVKTGVCTHFPVFIGGDETTFALDYSEYHGMFPEYYEKYIVNAATEENRREKLAVLFFQAVYTFYMVVGLNGHPYRHGDFHGRNALIRRTALAPATRSYKYVSDSGAVREVIIPNIGAEMVVGDFGKARYDGYFRSYNVAKRDHDLKTTFRKWGNSFRQKEWTVLEQDMAELVEVFSSYEFPTMETLLRTRLFSVFDTKDTPQRSFTFRIGPPGAQAGIFRQSQISMTPQSEFRKNNRIEELFGYFDRVIADDKMRKKITTSYGFLNGEKFKKAYENVIIQRYMEYVTERLAEFRSKNAYADALTRELNTSAGLTELIQYLALPQGVKDILNAVAVDGFVLSDFVGSSLEDIKAMISDVVEGRKVSVVHQEVLAIAVHNRVINLQQ